MSENIKVLVTGSTNGKFKELFTKAAQIHKKYGPFDVHLCTGNFFDAESNQETLLELINNKIDIPLTTYFIIGDRPLPDLVQKHIETTDGEVCDNLYFLGKQGILTTSEGLKIAFISGSFSETSSVNAYTVADIQKLSHTNMPASSPPGVDFLLSYEWPKSVNQFGAPVAINEELTSPYISELAAALKPRYHFAASMDVFYERDPYKNIVSGFAGPEERPAPHPTRFIGLGDVLNTEKHRWFYAFNLVPLSKSPIDALESLPPNTTENPFMQLFSGKRDRPDDEGNGSFFWGADAKKAKITDVPREGYVCKICNVPGHYIKDCPQKGREYVCRICNQQGHNIRDCPERQSHPREAAPLSSCWFCLANPKVEKHLIVSIGDELYATLAKGPVVSDSPVPGKGHLLIVPINHFPTFGKVPPEAQARVVEELKNYKQAIKQFFAKYDQDMVIFEVSRESARGVSHALLQVIPIPKSKSDQVEKVARELGDAAGMQFIDQIPENPNIPYFRLELPNGKPLVYLLSPQVPFNLQFGRLVVATVLGKPEREDWKMCSLTEEEEKKDAEVFKAAFKPFDFTLQ